MKEADMNQQQPRLIAPNHPAGRALIQRGYDCRPHPTHTRRSVDTAEYALIASAIAANLLGLIAAFTLVGVLIQEAIQ